MFFSLASFRAAVQGVDGRGVARPPARQPEARQILDPDAPVSSASCSAPGAIRAGAFGYMRLVGPRPFSADAAGVGR